MIFCLPLVIDYQSLLLTDWSCVQARVSSCVIGRGWRSGTDSLIQGDQKVSVHLMNTIQKVTNNVQSVPRRSPDVY